MNHHGRSDVRTLAAATIVGALLGLVPLSADATDVRLVNFVDYTYQGTSADLGTDGVANHDTTTSGVLRMELWAFYGPYTPGMGGYRLAVYPLPALAAGAQTGKIDSGPVPFSVPQGAWFFSMILTEYTGEFPGDDGYVLRYFINFPTVEYLGVPPPAKVQAFEYYNAALNHYFVTVNAQEIHDLDTGVHPGWVRTGYYFFVWNQVASNTSPVCRYYIPPGYGDSHFFSASPQECADTGSKFPQLEEETSAAFYVTLPDASTGACPSGDVPVYRLWNNRADSNHRYTTSPNVKSTMLAQGYVAEGYGPDAVAMCAPQ